MAFVLHHPLTRARGPMPVRTALYPVAVDLSSVVHPLGGAVTLAATVGGGAWWRGHTRATGYQPPQESNDLHPAVDDVLGVLRSLAVVVDDSDHVIRHGEAARQLGIVRDGELAHRELVDIVREERRTGQILERVVDVPRGPLGAGRLMLSVRAAHLVSGHVLLLLEDRTQVERVEAIRRDFVANVSHELKTPVGGLALLAEAVQEASDDPDAVAYFAGRMKIESDRLGRLVKEIVDLSRLQVSDALVDPHEVVITDVVTDAVDRCRVVAEGRGVSFEVRTDPSAVVFGDRDLLTTAVRNLVDNAVAYSDEGGHVVVDARIDGELVEVAVTDHGVGIPVGEQERVFERFYRVDPARSRATGGTGLGLSIVKHTAANHGGEVRLWSEEGNGSTFTLVLPLVSRLSHPEPPATIPTEGRS